VYHRDLHSRNVIIDEGTTPEQERVVLIDFGSAPNMEIPKMLPKATPPWQRSPGSRSSVTPFAGAMPFLTSVTEESFCAESPLRNSSNGSVSTTSATDERPGSTCSLFAGECTMPLIMPPEEAPHGPGSAGKRDAFALGLLLAGLVRRKNTETRDMYDEKCTL
ncbi:unnamed protein product, partial [Prorocentrum cordatum]